MALNAKTGKLIWYYQFTHHDLWDRDPPAPPNLVMVNDGDTFIPVVAHNKARLCFPLIDLQVSHCSILKKPVPKSDLPGEQTWPTQPIPLMPAPFARQSNDLTTADISPYAPNRDSLPNL